MALEDAKRRLQEVAAHSAELERQLRSVDWGTVSLEGASALLLLESHRAALAMLREYCDMLEEDCTE